MSPKRAFDLGGAALLLLALSPVTLAAAAAVALTGRGPVLRRTERLGRGGRTFTMFTFRITRGGALTPAGRLLRRHYLDLLPQLLNVLRGDMALVGPRPLPGPPGRSTVGRARLAVRPGMTGPWQIAGRSDLPWEEMGVLDLHYVEQHWLGLDLAILARTVPAAVRGRRPATAVRTVPVRVA